MELFEIDRKRFTCSGGTAAIDMMLNLITRQYGHELAAMVADQFIHERIRDQHDHQRASLPVRLGVRHPKLLAVIKLMEVNLEEPLTRPELARSAGLSTRQLERLFRKYLNRSPARYYLELRLNKARLLLLQTNMSVIDVALACGFVSASHFSKCYRDFFGRTPRKERGLPLEGAAGRLVMLLGRGLAMCRPLLSRDLLHRLVPNPFLLALCLAAMLAAAGPSWADSRPRIVQFNDLVAQQKYDEALAIAREEIADPLLSDKEYTTNLMIVGIRALSLYGDLHGWTEAMDREAKGYFDKGRQLSGGDEGKQAMFLHALYSYYSMTDRNGLALPYIRQEIEHWRKVGQSVSDPGRAGWPGVGLQRCGRT